MMYRHLIGFAVALALLGGAGCIAEPPASFEGDDTPADAGTGLDGSQTTDGDLDPGVDLGVDLGVDPGVDLGVDGGPDAAADAGTYDLGTPIEYAGRRSLNGLMLYYPFRDQQNAQIVDESGGGRSVALPVNSVLSPEGLSLSTGAFVEVTSDLDGLVQQIDNSGAFSIEMWVTTHDDLFSELFTFGAFRPSQVPGAGVSPNAPICVSNCSTVAAQVENALRRDEPTHVVFTGGAGVVRAYIGGVLAGAWRVGDIRQYFKAADPLELKFGSFTVARTYGLFAIFNRQLSPGEVLSHTLAGPRPLPSDEVSSRLGALFSVVSDDGLFETETAARTLVDGADGESFDGLVASSEQHGLIRHELRLPQAGQHIYSFLEIQSLPNELATAGTFELWQMQRGWTGDSTWNQTGTEPWAAPGATAPADRADAPLATREVGIDGQMYAAFNVARYVRDAIDGIREPFGFQVRCDGCALALDGVADRPWDTFRPRLTSLFVLARSAGGISPPEQITYGNGPENNTIIVSWNAQLPAVELYIDGRLVRHVRQQNTVQLPGVSATVGLELEAVSVDRWGRTSEIILVPAR